MNLATRSVRGSMLRVSMAIVFVCLVSGPTAARADDIVLRWNEIAARTATATSPFNQARVGAIVQLAVFEVADLFLEPLDLATHGGKLIVLARFVLLGAEPADALVSGPDIELELLFLHLDVTGAVLERFEFRDRRLTLLLEGFALERHAPQLGFQLSNLLSAIL